MTVPAPGPLTYSYDEDGITTVFAYPVRFFEPQELEVVREVGGVRTTLTYNVDYTVSGAGSPSGGSITRAAATDGGKIIITRNTAWKQIVDLTNNGRNPAESVEQQLDRLTMAGQDSYERFSPLADKADDLDNAVALANAAANAAEDAQAAAEGARDAALSAVPNAFPEDRTALKALDTSSITAAYLKEPGREGQFVWHNGDYSAQVAADTAEGVYIKADAVAATDGAWVRQRNSLTINVTWFGADPQAEDAGQADEALAGVASLLALNLNALASVYFPTGRYKTTAKVTFPGRKLVVFGDGPEASRIEHSGTDGLFAFSITSADNDTDGRVNVRHLGLQAAAAGAGSAMSFALAGAAISAGYSNYLLIESVEIGSKTAGEHYWNKGVVLDSINRIICSNCTISGKWGDKSAMDAAWEISANNFASQIHMSQCSVNWANDAVRANASDTLGQGFEGIHIIASDFVAVNRGIVALGQEPQLVVVGCHISYGIAGIVCGYSQFYIAGNLFYVTVAEATSGAIQLPSTTTKNLGHIVDNIIVDIAVPQIPKTPNSIGISLRNCAGITVRGNQVRYMQIGIEVATGSVTDSLIEANTVRQCTNGIVVRSGVYDNVIRSNFYLETTNHIVDQSSGSNYVVVVPEVQYTALVADFVGSDTSNPQPFFPPSQDTFEAEAETMYAFEAEYHITRLAGTNSHTTSLLFGGTATFTSLGYIAQVTNPTGNQLANVQQVWIGTASAFAVTANNTSATEDIVLKVKGTLRTNAGGTIIPQFQYSAAPGGEPTIKANSKFQLWKVGSSSAVSCGRFS